MPNLFSDPLKCNLNLYSNQNESSFQSKQMNCRKRGFAFRLCWKDMLPVYLLTIVFKNDFSICKVLRTKLVLPLMFEDYTSVQILSKSPALTTRQLQAPQTSPAAQTFAKEVTFLGKSIPVTNYCSLCVSQSFGCHTASPAIQSIEIF